MKLHLKLIATISAGSMLFCSAAPVLATDDATNAKREYVVSEFVQSVGRNNLTGSAYILSTFVDSGDIDEAYVGDFEKAVTTGIVRGYEDKTLLPKEDITRVEALAILERCVPEYVLDEVELVTPSFTDVPDWAKDTITNLYSLGIVKGYDEYTLGAEDKLTVEQVGLLTDRTDVYNNTVDINDGYFGYINNKALRNAPINAQPTIDYRHGAVSVTTGNWSYASDAYNRIAEREDDMLAKLMNGEIEYEQGSEAQRIHDMLLCIADQDNVTEADAAQVKRYVDSVLSTTTLDELVNVATELYKETGVNVLFNIEAGLTPDDHTVYPKFSLANIGFGGFIAFSSKLNTKENNDIYKTLFKSFVEAELEGYENADFTDADFENAISIQKIAGKDENYFSNYIMYLAIRMMFDETYTEEMFNEDMEQLAAEHPDMYSEEEGLTDTSEWFDEYAFADANEAINTVDLGDMFTNIGFKDIESVLLPYSETLNEQMSVLTEENLGALKLNAVLCIGNTINTNISEDEQKALDLLQQLTFNLLLGASTEEIFGQSSEEADEEPTDEDEDTDLSLDDILDDDSILNPMYIQQLTSLLPNDIGILYSKMYYSDEDIERAGEVVEMLWQGYVEVISACDWMSEETKQNALKKIANMVAVIGYPDNYDGPEIVSPENGGTYYSNIINIKQNDLQETIKACNEKTYIRETMICAPDMVNAFYMPTLNTITLPVGGMEWFFDPNASDAANLGSLGMVIGHEIGHAFDANGSQYDENGCLNNWWTEEDATKYEDIKASFIEYYSHFDVANGVVQDSTVTITENMADVSGMQVVMHILEGDKDAQKEALEAYAKVWGSIASDSDLTSDYYLSDVHSANQVRVNAVVASLDAFYEIYDIDEDSPMYVAPEDRIKLW